MIHVEVTLSLSKSVRKELLKEINFEWYIKERIIIVGNDECNYTGIYTSNNEPLLDYMFTEIMEGYA